MSCTAALLCSAVIGCNATGNESTPPTVGSNISFTSTTATTTTATWGAASDNDSAAANLEYKAVLGLTAESIDTAAEIEAITTGSMLLLDWTADTVTTNVTGLSVSTEYFVAVLVQDQAGNLSVYAPQSVTTGTGFPTVGTDLQLTPSYNTVGAAWGAATDAETSAALLQYKLVRANTAATIDTIAEAEAVTGDDLILDYTANTTTATAAGLNTSTASAFALIVKDADGHRTLYTPQTTTTLAAKRIFVSATVSNGQFSSNSAAEALTSADAICQADANKPATGIYKALLFSSALRVACTTTNCSGGISENASWVLAATTPYVRTDATAIGTTNSAAIFTGTLTNAVTSASAGAWSGLASDWTAGNNCTNWTSSSTTASGGSTSDASVANMIALTSAGSCALTTPKLYCVEQ